MVFWILALLIVAAVALPLLGALARGRKRVLSGAASDIGVYRDQLKEIDRDLARGALSEAEAEAVRTEVSRRLLEADRRQQAERAESSSRMTPVALATIAVLGLGSAALYWVIGAPGYADLPLNTRIAAIDAAAANRPGQAEAEESAASNLPVLPPGDPRFQELMEKLRETLKERPDDIQGLTLLAQNEARIGNFPAARAAQNRIIELKGDDATSEEMLMAIDIMVYGAGGYVSPEAEAVIRRLMARDPSNGAARYYAGLTLAQNGRPDQAFPIWRRLLENSGPDEPWVPVIRDEISRVAAAAGVEYTPPSLRGPTAGDVAAAEDMTQEDRQAMIRGMVEGLSERLATEGGSPSEWAQLINALGVLGETDRAKAILDEARTVFAADAEGMAQIEAAASRAGLDP